MQSGYMVVAKDGTEYGPVDRDTIQRWYYEGRVDRNSRVWEPGGHKFRLHEMFDLTVWNNPPIVTQAGAAEPTFKPTFVSDVVKAQNVRTPGMLAAAIILFVQAGIELLTLAALVSLKLMGPEPLVLAGPLGGAFIADLVVGAGLMRGNQRFRGWGLGRAVLGGVVGGLLVPLQSPSAAGWIVGGFQVLFSLGIASLLIGENPSKARLIAGVAATLIAWSGWITTYVVVGVIKGVEERRLFAQYTLKDRSFEDEAEGVTVALPDGWSILAKDTPIVKIPGAKFVAVQLKAGCYAALLIEPVTYDNDSLDGYLYTVLYNRLRAFPSIVDRGVADAEFGGNQGRRMETSWKQGGSAFRGFTTACRVGSNYYLLTGWCADRVYPNALVQFQTLERAFQIKAPPIPDDETPKSKSRANRATSRGK